MAEIAESLVFHASTGEVEIAKAFEDEVHEIQGLERFVAKQIHLWNLDSLSENDFGEEEVRIYFQEHILLGIQRSHLMRLPKMAKC